MHFSNIETALGVLFAFEYRIKRTEIERFALHLRISAGICGDKTRTPRPPQPGRCAYE